MSKSTRNIIMFILLVLSIFFTYKFIVEIQTYFSLKAEVAEDTKKEKELTDQKESLLKQIDNLNDVDYILRYARGKYLVTKNDGEQVFTLPDDEDKETNEEE